MSWHTVSLGDVLKMEGGFAFKSKDFEDIGCPIIRISNVDGGSVNVNDAARIPAEKVGRGEKYKLESGDILIAMSGATTGKLGVVPDLNNRSIYLNQRVGRFNFKSEIVDRNYLWFFLNSDICQNRIKVLAEGAAQPNISGGQIESIEIPLPPLSNQKKIAEILEKADQLRKDCQQMEQELNNLAQSVFIDMFGEPVSNPKDWPKVALAEMVESKDDIKCGPFGTQLAKSEFKLTGVPLWGIKNVNNGFRVAPHEFVSLEKAENLHTYSIEAGDIVMTRKGNVGNCHIYPAHLEDGIMHSDLLRIRPSKSKVDSAFLQKQLIYSRDVEDQLRLISQGAIMAGINVTKLKSLTLIYPPIDLQKKFSNIISSIDAQLSALAIVQQDHQENFNSLMQKAFNGELKLKPKAA